ncbi:hypothetical protein GKE82_24945 [Conexibacter sp. W3-3-2]|uniref:hypothetical protein n=1 Tax=Conexibacter sp. W3-3-2 TaxID=2675227 RepID=UPI0012B6EE43|nr:hypothetical protein [Conexibacter sp. W3-3-2]MTD47454.1 hypothetical protein [Conexibacter sp. W3-3-2]
MSAQRLEDAKAQFRSRAAAPRPALPRPAIRVERPRPPFPLRRACELTAFVAIAALVVLRVSGLVAAG